MHKQFFEMVIADNKKQSLELAQLGIDAQHAISQAGEMRAQKAKDDLTIDWMRHRVNALEKQNAVLLNKVAGVFMPVPEIVPTRPGSMSVPDFSALPSFEDVGDDEAKRLGIGLDAEGHVEYTK